MFQRKSILSAFGAGVFFGLYTVFSKLAVPKFGPEALGFWVILSANLSFLLYITLAGKARRIRDALRLWPYLLIMGVLSGILNLSSLVGVRLTTAANAGILMRCDIFFSAALGWILLRERVTVLELIGSVLMIMGALAVSGMSLSGFRFSSIGDFYLLLTAFLLAVNAFVIKYRLSDLGNAVIAFYNSGIAALCFLMAGIGKNILGQLTLVSVSNAAGFGFLACMFINFVEYLLYYHALEHLPVWFVRVACLAAPMVTTLMGVTIFGEDIHLRQGLGIGGVIVGAALILLRMRYAEVWHSRGYTV